MAWVLLLIAGLFEIGWAIGLTDGVTRVWPSISTGASMVISVALIVTGILGLKLTHVA